VAKKDTESKNLAKAYDALKESIRRAADKEIRRFNQAVEASSPKNSPKKTIPSPQVDPKM